MTPDVQPESINVLRIETFGGEQWTMLVHRATHGAFTGSIELHFCQGRVGKVQVKPKPEKVVDKAIAVNAISTR